LIIIAVDYNPNEISPWDLSMDKFIKTDTENVGAEALASYGATPPKRFKTLKIEGDAMPDYGAAVTKDGQQVGVVTSPAVSPRLGHDRAGDPRRRCRHRREKVEVAIEGGTAPPRSRCLSLLDPAKEKPRA
jgi:glycine cleavage system aminomethyltransferase T